MQFVELPRFSRRVAKHLDDVSLEALCAGLLDYPDLGDLLPGPDGFRQMPFTPQRKGERTEVRVIYYHRAGSNEICFLDLVASSEKVRVLARELADVRAGKVAPGRVWLVTNRVNSTVERHQISPEKYQRVQQVTHLDASLPATMLPGNTIPSTLSMSDDHQPTRPLRIFVVEDDPVMQETYRLHLEAAGHTVTAAFDMNYALQRLATRRYDVLIVDIGLPDGDGWEMMREVKLAHPLFAVAVTARSSEADREKSRVAGFRHHFVKPLLLRELDDVLREAAGEQPLWQ